MTPPSNLETVNETVNSIAPSSALNSDDVVDDVDVVVDDERSSVFFWVVALIALLILIFLFHMQAKTRNSLLSPLQNLYRPQGSMYGTMTLL